MNLISTFLELDKLYESADLKESSNHMDRLALIREIKAAGKNYNFDRYSDAQLYRIWERIQDDTEYYKQLNQPSSEVTRGYCNKCDTKLTDGGFCPNCDDGTDDLVNESLDILEIGNHITDHYIFPSAKAKYDCILDIKARYRHIDDMVDQDDLDQTVIKYGGKLRENKMALTEDLDSGFLDIEGFEYYIKDTFEDDGYIGYEVLYSKDGRDIVTVEVWEDDSGVTVINNLYAPNLMQRTYETFGQFAVDLEYKCETYLHENIEKTKSLYSCSNCGFETELADDEYDGCCPNCHEHHGEFGKCEESIKIDKTLREANVVGWKRLLRESAELSMDHAITSVVDQIKAIYEAGLFYKLPIGRENAFTLEISGPDKSRLVGYFEKQPEFNHEINSENSIISHEFISDKYDIEIFDSFVSMYKIPQNESLN